MCDDHPTAPAHQAQAGGLSRRRFLQALGLAGGASLVGVGGTALARPAIASGVDSTTAAVSMAMHIHASFSELTGSIESQFYQAAQNAVDVLWLSDHDHRMAAQGYRNVVHFTSLTAEKTDGGPWQWQRRTAGPLSSSSTGGIVTSPSSPNDTLVGGSLAVSARSTSTKLASLGYYAEAKKANLNYHGNLYGQTLTIDVLPTSIGTNGYLELLISSSYHPASSAGRPAGVYSLSYRFGGPGTPGLRVANGNQGIVYVGVTPNQWNTVSLTPCDDITALWSDVQATDFASFGLTLSAVSTGSTASGNFDYLRFQRQYVSGDVPLGTQRQLIDTYAAWPSYSGVAAYQGLEISPYQPHVNWFGPGVTLGDLGPVTSGNYPAYVQSQVGLIHSNGGVASYNHPFGTQGSLAADQSALVSQVAAKLLANDLYGCDIMEVGYPRKGTANLASHIALWDVLSRNGRFLTGNGTSDDHGGQNWFGQQNNWYTSVWAATKGQGDLVAALRAGRAWTASLSGFRGTLDLVADGGCPMGSVSVSLSPARSLQVFASGLPANGSVQVIRGGVDYSGATTPNSATLIAYPASAFDVNGSVTVPVDTTGSCFVRTQVLDGTGSVVALSNPIWLLDGSPPSPVAIPAERAC